MIQQHVGPVSFFFKCQHEYFIETRHYKISKDDSNMGRYVKDKNIKHKC